MKTQTKCTLALCGLFLVEILPLPFTAFISLFTVRRQPAWVLNAVNNLYADVDVEPLPPVSEEEVQATKKRCTRTLIAMMLIDLGPVPITIPVGLYVVRRRPKWFKNVVGRLYSGAPMVPYSKNERAGGADAHTGMSEELRIRYEELERKNHDFALALQRGPAALDSKRRPSRAA